MPHRLSTSVRARLPHRISVAPGPAVLLALFAGAGWVLASVALRVHTFEPDESIYVTQGRVLAAHFPQGLWDVVNFHYGIERLNPLLVALATSLFSDTAAAMELNKVLLAVAFASVTIPTYLLARGLGVGWPAAVSAAALSVAVPWAPLATSFLNEPVAYPAFAWAVYGSWRAAARPGWRSDVLALSCVGLAALARSNLAALVIVPVVAVIATELRFGTRESGLAIRSLVRRHVPLFVAVVGSVVYLLVKGTSTLAGVYPVDFAPHLSVFSAQAGAFMAFVAQGLTLIPVIVGSAWALRHLVRPLDAERFALAVVALTACLALLYSLSAGVREERYAFYIASLMTVMTVAAIARRDLPPLLAGIVGLGVALLVAAHRSLPPISSAYLTFAYPGQAWWHKVVRGRASIYLPDPLSRHPETTLLVAIPAFVVLTLFLLRRQRTTIGVAAGITLLCTQVALGAGAATWALANYVTKAGDQHGPGFDKRAWVDKHVPAGGSASAYVAEPGPTAEADALEVRFWNARASAGVLPATAFARKFDLKTGAPRDALPSYLLISGDRMQRVGLEGRPVAVSPYRPIQLWQTSTRTRAAWIFSGATQDGWVAGPRSRIVMRTWRHCVRFNITAPPDSAATVVLRPARGRPAKSHLAPGRDAVLRTSAAGVTTLSMDGNGSLPPHRRVSGLITEVSAASCGG